jgi:hypothetical protein
VFTGQGEGEEMSLGLGLSSVSFFWLTSVTLALSGATVGSIPHDL